MHKQDVLDAIQQYQKLSNEIRDIAIKMATVRHLMYRDDPETCYIDFEIDTFDGKQIIIANFSEYYCGEENYSNIEIPLHYFWTADVVAAETEAWAAQLKASAEAAELRKIKEKRLREEKDEERNRKLYEQLKNKYEGTK